MVDCLNYGQMVIGPAGSGKSTYCQVMQEHGATLKRNIRVINLDPAAEKFGYNVDIDIKELISVEDVMEKLKFGPNGALVYSMEYIVKNFNWLEERINEYGDNNYFLIDCPGQLELYSHLTVMNDLTKKLKRIGINLCSVYCLDSTFLTEQSKFISGCVISLATMIQMELPHMNIVTKCDLIQDKDLLENIMQLDFKSLSDEKNLGKNMKKLNESLIDMIENYSLIDFFPLNIKDEDSINSALYQADTVLQYYDNQEPKEEYYRERDESESNKMDEY